MEEIRENLNSLLEKEGLMRGEVVLNHINFIKQKEGQDGVERIKRSFEELDNSLDLNIDPMDWKNVSIGSVITALSRDLFEWEKEDIKEMGRYAAKTLTVNKLMFREIPDLDSLIDKVGDYWKAVINAGQLSVKSKSITEREVELKLEGFNYHPLDFLFISGYIEVVFNLFTNEEVSVKHNLQNEVCNFLITWN